MVSISAAVGALVWTGIGGVVAWNGWTSYQGEHDRIENATTVEAEITTAETYRQEGEGHGENGEYGVDVRPALGFEYEYEGETYESDNKYPPSEGIDRRYESAAAAEEYLDGYAEGDTVTAYVDPDDPSEAFLETETNDLRNLGVTAVGGVMALIGLAGVVAALVVL
ncbi:MAG: DUF3592 domain-containing protein [Halobaculum sp.]